MKLKHGHGYSLRLSSHISNDRSGYKAKAFVKNIKMVELSSIFLCCVSGFHIHIGLGNLFKLPPLYDPSNFLVNGKPGTGSTEIEKFLEFVFGLWYTGSIAGVLLMFFCGSSAALCGALICPLYYHSMLSIAAFL